MTDDSKVHAQVHRFRDAVAAYLGSGETVYLSPDAARRLARALTNAADDITARPFVESTVGTFELATVDGRRGWTERDSRGRAVQGRGADRETESRVRRPG